MGRFFYKIYEEGPYGYETALIKGSPEDVISILDQLITPNRMKKILVVEHNKEWNYDAPWYLYKGNYNEYLDFRKIIMEPEKVMSKGGLNGRKIQSNDKN